MEVDLGWFFFPHLPPPRSVLARLRVTLGRVLGGVISTTGECQRGNSREVPCGKRTGRRQGRGPDRQASPPSPPTLSRDKEDEKRTADFVF